MVKDLNDFICKKGDEKEKRNLKSYTYTKKPVVEVFTNVILTNIYIYGWK